jgi:predicted metal-dependent hydrolase
MQLLPIYTIVLNKRLKHTSLSLDERGDLIIKSPTISQKEAEKLIIKKSSWINRNRKKLLERKTKTSSFNDLKVLYFKGKEYNLILQKDEFVSLHFNKNEFILKYDIYNEDLFQVHIDHFYKMEAQKFIPSLVKKWEEIMQVKANKISFRKTKRQWGSCSAKNILSFNTMIIKLPQDVIQYIIVHELAHIKYKHHQKEFWKEIEKYIPKYKQYTIELKNYSTQ